MDNEADDANGNRALVAQAADRAIVASLAAPVETFGVTVSGQGAETASRPDPSPAFNPIPAFNPPLAFNPTTERVMTTTEDLMAFGQANIDAMMKSGQIWAAGIQDLSKQMASSAQAQFDQAMSTFKAMASAKSVKEAMDMQAGLARAALDAAVSGTGKLTDASMKLSEEAIAPISARLSVAAEKFGRVAA